MWLLGPPYLDHVKCGQGQQALAFYQQMYLEGVEPNPAYFVGVSIMALEEGRCVHEQIIQSRYKSDVFVGNCLIDMYAKCGSIEDAWRVFNRMAMHDVIAWSAMILGQVKCGQGHKVLELSANAI
jgi:pentatricopeptide repeat protein